MKHRKLFPSPTTNESLVCPDVCDATCPYGCYPYSDTYFVPPPLPLPPPGPPSSTKHVQNILPYVVIIASLLGITLIIIGYYLLILKNCFGWIRPRPRSRHQRGAEENFLDEDHEPEIDHPIWYIRTIGLQPSIINSITVFKYKKGDSLIEGTDCSVCLSEFQDDEILRLLPKCSHAFHIPCIDTWLRSHTNCPVCRAGIVVNGLSTPVARNEDNQVEIIEINHPENDGEVDDNRIGLEEEVEYEIPQESIDIQGETTKIGVEFDDSDENNPVKYGIQQLKRSISADSLVNLPIEFGESPFDDRGDEEICAIPEQNGLKTRMNRINDDAVIGQSSHQRDVPVKRSFSYSGRSFLSRNSRSSNSILPL